jgi:sporulation protein YlmC with PRC-barrel domain
MEHTLYKCVRAAFVPAVAVCLAAPAFGTGDTGAKAGKSAGATATQAQKQGYRALRASHLIGKDVKSPQGKNLGKLEDLIVDMNTGQVRYSILSFDPGIFSGERLFAVPTAELRLSADKDELVYNMTRERLEKAQIDKNRWPGVLRDRDYVAGLDRAYGLVQPSNDRRAYSAKELVGKDVNNRQGNDIGEIKDLVINMNAQTVHYAVLGFDPSLAAPEKLFAFPLRAFNFTDGKDELVLDIDKAKLQAMRSFDTRLWSRLNDPVLIADVDRYLVTVTPVVTVTPSPTTLFTRLDKDEDGHLTQAEARANTGVQSAWSKLDQNKDGKVSRAEFMANYKMDATQGAVGATGASSAGGTTK